jgi:hypothetical protein
MTQRNLRFCAKVFSAVAVAFVGLVIGSTRAKADIFETNNAGSCSGGGSQGGGLCYESSPGVYVPYSLSGLLSGAYGTLTIGPGTTEYVVTDNIVGGTFSYVYNSTTQANNATCQVDGGTTSDFAKSSVACTILDSAGNQNTGTINSTGAFTTGPQINNLKPPATITFDATDGYGATFDLGFVSMQGTGTVAMPEGSSSAVTLLMVLVCLVGCSAFKSVFRSSQTPPAKRVA